MEALLRDLVLAVRQVRRRPIWSLTIVLVLAIGIGGNSAMYAGFETWVLRPLDLRDPESLVDLSLRHPSTGRSGVAVSARELGEWRSQQDVFEELAAYQRVDLNLSDTEEPARVLATRVSAELLPLLGKQPRLGRGIEARDDLPGAPAAVALISDDLWRERFGGDPEVLGRIVRLDGVGHEVVGVMEPGFAFPEWADVWTPLGADPDGGSRAERTLSVIGRLRGGVPRDGAEDAMRQLHQRPQQELAESERGWTIDVLPLRQVWAPRVIEVALLASMGAALFVLLVICANVGGLVLANATSRQREFAVRSALGAGRGQLARQTVAETTVLAVCGGLVGLPIARIAVSTMLTAAPVDPPYLFAMSFSPWAAFYTFLVALFAGAVCGWMPFTRWADLGSLEGLAGGARAGQSRRLSRARSWLVVTELALSTALVIGALLMAKSFLRQQDEVRGFASDGVLSTDLALRGAELESEDQRLAAVERLLSELESVRELDAFGVTSRMMTTPGDDQWELLPRGRALAAEEAVVASVAAATSGYFEALSIPLERGRGFTAAEDVEGGASALVSASLAERLWPGEEALGRELRRTGDDQRWWRVVGVVEDVRLGRDMVSNQSEPAGQLYLPWASVAGPRVVVAVRSPRPARQAAGALRSAIERALPTVPPGEMLTLDESILRAGWTTRFFGLQLAQYAAVAVLIAAVGLYGLVADSVQRRKRELATRAAFGARRQDLVRLILREAGRLGAIGVALGVVLAAATTRFGASMLVGVGARDPVVYAAVGLALLAVTLLAAGIPALRASRSDPAEVLRGE